MLSRKVNILLLGETGVGKSTFINMFGNYLSEKPLPKIASQKCNFLVPTKFTLMNDDLTEEVVEIGSSEYEIPGVGCSATQRPQMYVFNYPEQNVIINMIDTPGVGDTRGPEHDKNNTEMLLAYISELDFIDAFCILLKPDVTKISVQFEVCLKQVFEQLDTSITKNIIFLFTNGRMRHFTAGDTQCSLNTLLAKIKKESGSIIPFRPSNMFCIDNESFRYIAARQRNLQFSQNDIQVYEESFNRSAETIKNMITYIISLRPAKMQGITSINESKRIIQRLIDPLLSLVMSYEAAIDKIEEYNKNLQRFKTDIEYLKKHMYKIEYVPITTENTVDTGKTDFNFCFNFSWSKLSWKALLNPFKFVWNIFKNTQTSKTVHLKEIKVLDTETINFIKDRESGEKAVQDKLYEMKEHCNEFEREIKTVLTAIANFSVFIENLKLIAGSDLFESIMVCILKEYHDNKTLLERIRGCVQKYTHIKSRIREVNAKDIMVCVNDLFQLKHTGEVFKEIMDKKVDFDKVVFKM